MNSEDGAPKVVVREDGEASGLPPPFRWTAKAMWRCGPNEFDMYVASALGATEAEAIHGLMMEIGRMARGEAVRRWMQPPNHMSGGPLP